MAETERLLDDVSVHEDDEELEDMASHRGTMQVGEHPEHVAPTAEDTMAIAALKKKPSSKSACIHMLYALLTYKDR